MPIVCKITLNADDFKADLDAVIKLTEKLQSDGSKAAQTVSKAAEKSAKSVENVKKVATEAAESHKKEGDEAEKAAAKTENTMKKAAGSIKGAAGATQGIVSALGGVSPQLGLIGQGLQMLLSGPVAAVTAAVSAMISAAVMLWDTCTVSAEEYRKKLAAILDLQGKVTERIQDGMETSERYLNRLEEIDRMENKSNSAKAEQARLLEILTKRYGDLGIAIDKDTGKMSGFDEARKRMRGADTSNLADSLQKEYEIKLKQVPQIEVSGSSGTPQERARLEAVLAGYDPDKVQRSFQTYSSGGYGPTVTHQTMSGPKITMQQERDFLDDYLKNAKITDEATTEALKARIDALDDILKTSDEITKLRASGYSSEADEMAAMSAATSRENTQTALAAREKEFAQNRDLAAMSGEDRAEALRNLIQMELSKIDRLGEMPEKSEELFKSRQRLSDLQKQLDTLDTEKQRRRDEADDAYAATAGLTPVEKAELLRNRLGAAQKAESGYKAELAELEKPGQHRAGDEDRKLSLREKIVQSQERILDLTQRVAEAEAEAIRQEQEAQNRVTSYLDAKKQDLEVTRLEAAAEYEKADALRLENELQAQGLSLSKQQLDEVKKTAKERNAITLRSNIRDQATGLRDAALRNVGRDAQADIEQAIREAEKTKRSKLSQEEREDVIRLTKLTRAVEGKTENPLAYTPDLSIKTNELTGRGGFSSGAVAPSVEKINKSILSELQKNLRILNQIETILKEGLST